MRRSSSAVKLQIVKLCKRGFWGTCEGQGRTHDMIPWFRRRLGLGISSTSKEGLGGYRMHGSHATPGNGRIGRMRETVATAELPLTFRAVRQAS